MHENVVEIPLDDNGKHFAIVDEADFHLVVPRVWGLNNTGYAANYATKDLYGKRTSLLMHRLLLGLQPGDKRDVDHIDKNKLNNRRSNLRVCSRSENQRNTDVHTDNVSGYKGVTWDKRRNTFGAVVALHGKHHFAGSFSTAKEAAAARDALAKKLHGEFFRPSTDDNLP